MKKESILTRTDIFLLLLIIGLYILGAVFYPQLPDKVPSHWNIRGEIDGYMGKTAFVIFLPTMSLGLYLLLLFIPFIDPRAENYRKFLGVYNGFKILIILFMASIHIITLLISLGYPFSMDRFIRLFIGVMFIFLGNYMGKLRHNYTFGIKTPWTLASEEVWNKTHRVSGPLWMLVGVFWMVSIFLDETVAFILAMSFIFAAVLFSVVYSYLEYKKINDGI